METNGKRRPSSSFLSNNNNDSPSFFIPPLPSFKPKQAIRHVVVSGAARHRCKGEKIIPHYVKQSKKYRK